MKAFRDNLIVSDIDARNRKSEGGIYMPDTAESPVVEGVVVSAGPGRVEHGAFVATEVKEGDHVLFGGPMKKPGTQGESLRKNDDVHVPPNTHRAPSAQPVMDAAKALGPHHIAFAIIKRAEGLQLVRMRLTQEMLDKHAVKHWPANVPEITVDTLTAEVERHIEGGWR